MPENYKGLTVPLYTEAADGPAAFRSLVDSGPIPRFANTAARNTAIPTPVKGQLVARNDAVGGLEVYDGTGWKLVVPALPPDHTHSADDVIDDGSHNLLGAVIPNLNADKITAGTIASARLPAGTASTAGALRLGDASNEAAPGNHTHAGYLARSGGDMTGQLRLPGGTVAAPALTIGGQGGLFSDTTNSLEMKAGAENFRFSGNGQAFLPGVNNRLGLGGSSYKWTSIWAVDGGINTSDPSLKHIDGRVGSVLDMIRKIDPILFRWRERDTDTRHYGFDATEIAEVIPEVVVGEPGNLGIRERDLLAILWAAIRELDRRLETA